jgi:CysZ protein
VLAAGAVVAALLLVPVVNLITPIFGAALMVHLHKKLTQNPAERMPLRRDNHASIEKA